MIQHLQWVTDEWRTDVRYWIDSQLAHIGLRVTGPIEQPHIRPWATAMRIPTQKRTIWFKATTQGIGYEVQLTLFLANLLPQHTPSLIASDNERCWMLMEDMGETLRSRISTVTDLYLMEKAIEIYADLQKIAAVRIDDLSATGIPDRRLTPLRIQWDELIRDTDRLFIDQYEYDYISGAHFNRAIEMWPEISRLLTELESVGLPDTVVHEDLHDANIFAKGNSIILSDWGDSCISNPLCTLTVFLSSMTHRLGLNIDAPEIVAVRDSYLEHWEEFASRAQLVEAAKIAVRIGMLHRSLSWRNTIISAPEESVTEYADHASGWLDEFVGTFDPI